MHPEHPPGGILTRCQTTSKTALLSPCPSYLVLQLATQNYAALGEGWNVKHNQEVYFWLWFHFNMTTLKNTSENPNVHKLVPSDGDLAPTWATYPLQPQYKHFQLCLIIVAIRVLQVLKQLFRWISHVATLISIVMRSHVDFSFLRLQQLRLLINNPTVWIESDRSFRRLWAKPSVLRRNVFDRIQDVTIHPIHFPQETGILYHNEVDELISMMRTYSVRTPQDNWLFVGGHSLLHHGSLRMLRTPSWKMGSI